MIKTNDKVVCIDARVRAVGADQLEAGKVYVVRGTLEADGERGLYLVGLCGGWWTHRRFYDFVVERGEVSYDVRRFRKLTDIQAENISRRAATSEIHNHE